MASTGCTWQELLTGLEEEPALSLAVLDPGVVVGPEFGGDSIFVVAPDGVVEPVAASVAPYNPTDVVDWDKLEILAPNDDEGRLEIVRDERFYELLGLRAEDEQANMARQAAGGDGVDAAAANGAGAAAGSDRAGAAAGGVGDRDGVAADGDECWNNNKIPDPVYTK